MTNSLSDVAVVGLGVMGANLARNFASRGHAVAVFNRTTRVSHELAANHPEAGLRVCETLEELVAALAPPRRIVLMVPAGAVVDAMIDALDPLLSADDVLIDGGNSRFTDTDRRAARAAGRPWRFVGMGVSGGEEGALRGPSIMPGGDPEAWERLRPLLESIAARSDSGPCVAHCGLGSAGHFVKMVHNGIEYGDMQLIAETAVLLRSGLGLDAQQVAEVFSAWNEGDLESYLIEITAKIFRTPDPKAPDAPLVDAILDRAGQKGTGRWTVQAALELGVAMPTVSAALDARVMSANVEGRAAAEAAFGARGPALFDAKVTPDDLRDALYASKVASYTQGFELMSRASAEYGYQTNLGEMARIWKAGCIIRARFLDRVRAAFDADGQRPLVMAPDFRDDLVARLPGWRRVVTAAQRVGLPVPGLAASLAWFDTLTTARGSASLIQAQRDFFGSHTYERRDDPGVPVHTSWE